MACLFVTDIWPQQPPRLGLEELRDCVAIANNDYSSKVCFDCGQPIEGGDASTYVPYTVMTRGV